MKVDRVSQRREFEPPPATAVLEICSPTDRRTDFRTGGSMKLSYIGRDYRPAASTRLQKLGLLV